MQSSHHSARVQGALLNVYRRKIGLKPIHGQTKANRGKLHSRRRKAFELLETEISMYVWNIHHGRGCKMRAMALQSPVAASEWNAAMYHLRMLAKPLKLPRTQQEKQHPFYGNQYREVA
jgi:hypothetical protein